MTMMLFLLYPFIIYWFQGLKARLLRRHRILQEDLQANYVETFATNNEDKQFIFPIFGLVQVFLEYFIHLLNNFF